MWQYDFHLFYMGAQAILQGSSPYILWDFNGPYPLALIFVPLALLPEPVAYFVYIAANLGLLWKLLGLKRSLWALLSFPVLFCLFVGQVDLLLALVAILASPWALGIIALIKPQVALILLPYSVHSLAPRDYWKAFVPAVLLLALSFLLSPDWVANWRAGSPGMVNYADHASNIYWLIPASKLELRTVLTVLGAILVLVASFWVKDRKNSWTLISLFAPLSNIYSAAILAEWFGPLETLLSWIIILVVGGDIHHGAPLFLVNLTILIKPLFSKLKSKTSTA